ncbi:cellulase family glycosylhydrolase [Vallicoccus soli]|uniref:cellulase family glycosylhydrolase n=1 Tax=Vallicoccus soli TaxID=2339232 RepID=UPI001402441F|nr:cellulase family glycosylhydrolase [Vallicoccus soli]
MGTAVLALLLAVLAGSGATPPEGPAEVRGEHHGPVVGAQFHGLWDEWGPGERALVLDRLAARGVRHLRIDVSWAMIQPAGRDRYDMAWGVPFVDRVLAMAHERGFEVTATFWLTPEWARPPRGERSLPADPADYAAALRWAAERWRDEVVAWEVWNEPNSATYLDPPDPVAYTRLLRAAHGAVRAGDRSAWTVLGGTEYVDVDWLRRCYEAGAQGSFDVLAVHPYPSPSDASPLDPVPPEGHGLRDLDALLAEMDRRGDASPVWLTELGWSVHGDLASTPPWARGVDEAEQARHLQQALELLRTEFPRVRRVYWYAASDTSTGRAHQDHFGLLRRDGSPRPVLDVLGCHATGRCGRPATG